MKILGPRKMWKALVLRSTHSRLCGVVIVNFEHISHPSLVLLLLTLNMYLFAGMLKVDRTTKVIQSGKFMGGVLKCCGCPLVWMSNYSGNKTSVEIFKTSIGGG